MIRRYRWRGGEEHSLAIEAGGPTVLILPPFFAEANRTRRLLVDVMRMLAAEDIGSLLPDLPGTGESLTPLPDIRLDDWCHAAAACAATIGRPFVTLALRGGALVDDISGSAGHLRVSPVDGAAILRDMFRARLAADREDGTATDKATLERLAGEDVIELAGNRLSPAMIEGLRDAVPAAPMPLRTLRLESEAASADARIAAAPLWRRAEPDEDPGLAAAIAVEAAHWARTCVG